MARKNDYIAEIDKFIGNKIVSLRLARGLSRKQLSEARWYNWSAAFQV